MARPIRDPRLRRERPGEKPLLQGHLRPGGVAPRRAGDDVLQRGAGPARPEPATDVAAPAAAVTRGKATRSPAETTKRRHLEGSEQGPA